MMQLRAPFGVRQGVAPEVLVAFPDAALGRAQCHQKASDAERCPPGTEQYRPGPAALRQRAKPGAAEDDPGHHRGVAITVRRQSDARPAPARGRATRSRCRPPSAVSSQGHFLAQPDRRRHGEHDSDQARGEKGRHEILGFGARIVRRDPERARRSSRGRNKPRSWPEPLCRRARAEWSPRDQASETWPRMRRPRGRGRRPGWVFSRQGASGPRARIVAPSQVARADTHRG